MTPDLEERIGRIRRAREESEKFVAEPKKLMDEAMTREWDRMLAPWRIALSRMAVGAALFGVGTAFIKFIGA
ncbi:hypothetical protein [Methylobacterium sp. Leaf113]|uniref:hypothetical protein n=1 Tax=Methylobacterium sp. Leaf113 TaxID=1736259 RepID=UPI003083196F